MSRVFWFRGDRERSDEHIARAVGLVEDRPLSPTKARVFAQRARNVYLAGDCHRGLVLAERALPLVEQIGEDELVAHVANTVGMCRVTLGNRSGLDDIRRSVALAEASSRP